MTRGHTFFCVICGRENQVGEHTARCREVQAAHKLEMISPGWRRSEASRWGRRGVAAAALWRDSIFPPLLGVPTTSISVYMSGLKLSHHTRAKDSTWQQCSTLWNLYTPWTLRDWAISCLWVLFYHYCCFLLVTESIFLMGTQFTLAEIITFIYILQIQNPFSSTHLWQPFEYILSSGQRKSGLWTVTISSSYNNACRRCLATTAMCSCKACASPPRWDTEPQDFKTHMEEPQQVIYQP